jgi:hypothetical protein
MPNLISIDDCRSVIFVRLKSQINNHKSKRLPALSAGRQAVGRGFLTVIFIEYQPNRFFARSIFAIGVDIHLIRVTMKRNSR